MFLLVKNPSPGSLLLCVSFAQSMIILSKEGKEHDFSSQPIYRRRPFCPFLLGSTGEVELQGTLGSGNCEAFHQS